MSKKFTSILDQLSDYAPQQNKELFIESRAQQAIASIINLKKLIEHEFNKDEAEDLNNRLLLAIKNNDETKFTRKIRKIRESKQK